MSKNEKNDLTTLTTVKWSIRWKLMAIVTLLMVGLVAILSYIQISSQKKMLESELKSRIQLMKANLIERGKSYVGTLCEQVENDIASFNLSGVMQAVNACVINNQEVKYAILTDFSGLAFVHTQKPNLVETILKDPRSRKALREKGIVAKSYQEKGESLIEIVRPVQVSMEPWGVLRVIYTLKFFEAEIDDSRKEIREETNKMIYRSIITALGFLGICLIVVFVFSTKFSKPLIRLTESARKLSKGDFSVSSDLNIRSRDEVGVLGETFVEMSKDLKDSYQKLEEYSKSLEAKVAERTGELKKALEDTAEAWDRVDGIVKSVADGLIVTDVNNRVILMNRPAEDLLGVRLSEVIDRPIDFAIADETLRDRVRSTLEKRATGYEFDFEVPGDDPKHRRIMSARTSVMYDKQGNQTGIVTIIHDVTHKRDVERMKTEFISTAAHELRTPLTSIQGFSEIMLTRDDITNEEKKRFLSYINKQAVSLTMIVSDLLDITRIESGRGFTLKKVPCNITDIVRQVVPYFQGQTKKHRFEVHVPEEPVEVHVDKEKLDQVLKNLISNAVKYSPNGGLLRVTVKVTADLCQVAVEDRGIGMTPEQVEKIFDKFYRADTSNAAVDGTGLGMTIVQHIVEAHGGKIWVESEFEKGTTVTFTIPID